jgi:DNA-binding response OmpR family regulator
MSGPLILIVEDEDSIRLTLRDYLKKKNHEVIVASDGVGAIKQMLDQIGRAHV